LLSPLNRSAPARRFSYREGFGIRGPEMLLGIEVADTMTLAKVRDLKGPL
jgi:hypothetical protein